MDIGLGAERKIIDCEGERQAILVSIAESSHANIVREWARCSCGSLPAGTSAKAGISGVFSGSRWRRRPIGSRERVGAGLVQRRKAPLWGEGRSPVQKEERYRLVRSLDKPPLPALRAGEYARAGGGGHGWMRRLPCAGLGRAERGLLCPGVICGGRDEARHSSRGCGLEPGAGEQRELALLRGPAEDCCGAGRRASGSREERAPGCGDDQSLYSAKIIQRK